MLRGWIHPPQPAGSTPTPQQQLGKRRPVPPRPASPHPPQRRRRRPAAVRRPHPDPSGTHLQKHGPRKPGGRPDSPPLLFFSSLPPPPASAPARAAPAVAARRLRGNGAPPRACPGNGVARAGGWAGEEGRGERREAAAPLRDRRAAGCWVRTSALPPAAWLGETGHAARPLVCGRRLMMSASGEGESGRRARYSDPRSGCGSLARAEGRRAASATLGAPTSPCSPLPSWGKKHSVSLLRCQGEGVGCHGL